MARRLADRLTAPEPARVARLLMAATEAKEATGQERTLLAAAAAVARQELGTPPGRRRRPLERIDRTLGLPRVRTVRGPSWPCCNRPSARLPDRAPEPVRPG